MFIDGIQVVEGSSVSNLTVASGASFPAFGSLGELFYYTGAEAGLYIYSNSGCCTCHSVHLQRQCNLLGKKPDIRLLCLNLFWDFFPC